MATKNETNEQDLELERKRKVKIIAIVVATVVIIGLVSGLIVWNARVSSSCKTNANAFRNQSDSLSRVVDKADLLITDVETMSEDAQSSQTETKNGEIPMVSDKQSKKDGDVQFSDEQREELELRQLKAKHIDGFLDSAANRKDLDALKAQVKKVEKLNRVSEVPKCSLLNNDLNDAVALRFQAGTKLVKMTKKFQMKVDAYRIGNAKSEAEEKMTAARDALAVAKTNANALLNEVKNDIELSTITGVSQARSDLQSVLNSTQNISTSTSLKSYDEIVGTIQKANRAERAAKRLNEETEKVKKVLDAAKAKIAKQKSESRS